MALLKAQSLCKTFRGQLTGHLSLCILGKCLMIVYLDHESRSSNWFAGDYMRDYWPASLQPPSPRYFAIYRDTGKENWSHYKYWGYMGIMEKKMEATLGSSYMPNLKIMEAPKLFSQHPGASLPCSMGRGPSIYPQRLSSLQ